MANNLRTFYACQAVAVNRLVPGSGGQYTGDSGTYTFIHGVQSVGINSSFDFENIFELGQLEIYSSVLNIPEIEITIEKVLDGYITVYGLISSGQPLAIASKNRADIKFGIYSDEGNAAQASESGKIVGVLKCTGMYVNNVTYTFPVEGNCTESVTLVGNHKSWSVGGSGLTIPQQVSSGNDSPIFDSGSAFPNRLVRRQDITYTGPGSAKAQNITLTLNLGREDVFEFGKRIPYAKFATYPVEATAEIQSLAASGSYDDVEFTQDTYDLPEKNKVIQVGVKKSNDTNVFNVTLSGAFLTSIAHGGGDATGGNATVTRSYTAYNYFTVGDSGTT